MQSGENDIARETFGFPEKMLVQITLDSQGKACFDLAWCNKPALRIPEAFWWGFNPVRPLTAIQKISTWVDPKNVVSKGNREMHGTSGLIDFNGIILNSIDAPLLAVDETACYSFRNQVPECTKGIWLNLFNNQWGTNFPMWYEDDARFRVEIYEKK